MSSKMSAAKEAKVRRSRLKRPSKAKLSLLKQVLVKNCFSKTQKAALPPKEPHLKTDTERAVESIFGSSLQPTVDVNQDWQVGKLVCWPKKSLETIFASPFQPVGFAFKLHSNSSQLLDDQGGEAGGRLTTLEAADLDAWDESWDRAWARQLPPCNEFKSGGKMFSLQENQDERGVEEEEEEEEEAKIKPSLFPSIDLLYNPTPGGAYDKEVARYKEKMEEYEQEMAKSKTSLEKCFPI